MTKRIFKSILAVSVAVLLICMICISYVLYGYFGGIIEKELKEEASILSQEVQKDEDFLKSIQKNSTRPFSTDPKDIKIYLARALESTTLNRNGIQHIPDCIKINKVSDANIPILFQLLILHKTLKDVRNTMNHASDEQKYRLKSIIRALKYYMKWIKQLNPNLNLQSNLLPPAAL